MPENMINTILTEDFALGIDLHLPEHTVNAMLKRFLPSKPVKDVEVAFFHGYFEVKAKVSAIPIHVPVQATLELVDIQLDAEHCWVDVKEHHQALEGLTKLAGMVGAHFNDMISVHEDMLRIDLTKQYMQYKARSPVNLELLLSQFQLKPVKFEPGFVIIKVIKGLEFL